MPNRNGTSIHAVAQSRNDPADNHLRDAGRGKLEYRADAQDGASKHDGAPPSEPLAKEKGEQGAK